MNRLRNEVASIDALIKHVGCGSVDEIAGCILCDQIRVRLKTAADKYAVAIEAGRTLMAENTALRERAALALPPEPEMKKLSEDWREKVQAILVESSEQRDKQRVIYSEGKAMAMKYCADQLDAALLRLSVSPQEHGTPEGLCTACSSEPCAEHAPPYRADIEREGCESCSHGRQWEVYGPDDVGVGGMTFDDREEAEHLAEMLNDAHAVGFAASPCGCQAGAPGRICERHRAEILNRAASPAHEPCGLKSGWGPSEYGCQYPVGHKGCHRNGMGYEWAAASPAPQKG